MTFEERYQKAYREVVLEVIVAESDRFIFPYAEFSSLGLWARGYCLLDEGLRRQDWDTVMRGFVFIGEAATRR